MIGQAGECASTCVTVQQSRDSPTSKGSSEELMEESMLVVQREALELRRRLDEAEVARLDSINQVRTSFGEAC